MTAQPSTPLPALTLQFEQPQDGPSVDALIARAFGPGRFTKVSERVREFATFTSDLHALADWLTSCQVDTVVMESTGVFWIPVFELLARMPSLPTPVMTTLAVCA